MVGGYVTDEYIEVVLDERHDEEFYTGWEDREYEEYEALLLDAHDYITAFEQLDALLDQYARDVAWKANTEELPDAGTGLSTYSYDRTQERIEEIVEQLSAAGDDDVDGLIAAASTVEGVLTKTLPANPLFEDRFHAPDEHMNKFDTITRYYPAPFLYHDYPETRFKQRFLYRPKDMYNKSVFDLAEQVATDGVESLDDILLPIILQERGNAQILTETGHPVHQEQVDSRVVEMDEYSAEDEPDDVSRTFQ